MTNTSPCSRVHTHTHTRTRETSTIIPEGRSLESIFMHDARIHISSRKCILRVRISCSRRTWICMYNLRIAASRVFDRIILDRAFKCAMYVTYTLRANTHSKRISRLKKEIAARYFAAINRNYPLIERADLTNQLAATSNKLRIIAEESRKKNLPQKFTCKYNHRIIVAGLRLSSYFLHPQCGDVFISYTRWTRALYVHILLTVCKTGLFQRN